MAEAICDGCRYDLSTHRGDWAFAASGPSGVDGFIAANAVSVHCPACGGAMSIALASLGLSPTQQDGKPRLVRFVDGGSTDIGVVGVGLLKMHMGDRLITRTLRELCYPAVPLFVEELLPGQTLAKKRFPDLPLRPEALDMVDWAEQLKLPPPQLAGDQVTYNVRLKGKARAEMIPVRVTDVAGIPGVALDFWPDLPYSKWHRYFVRTTVRPEAKKALEAKKQQLVAFVDAQQDNVSHVHELVARGVSLAATTTTRPRWAAIELRAAQGAAVAGGAFFIEPATQEYPEADSVQIAIDFGTSNTCIAIQQGSSTPEPLPFLDLTRRVVRGPRPEAPHDEPVHQWPLSAYGPSGVILPTELLFSTGKQALTVGGIEAALPLVDFSLVGPGSDLSSSEREENHVHAEFKWASGDAGPRSRALQRRYLELCFLFTLAQLAKRSWLPSTSSITVHGSYPLAFDDTSQKALTQTFQAALSAAELDAFGSQKRCSLAAPFVDESVAAGRVAKISGATEAIVVDIGGGSTDIALVRPDDQKLHWEVITSVKYAGTGLLNELVKSNFIRAVNLSVLRRRLRELGSVNELLKDSTLMPGNYKVAVINKTKLFYAHLREYLARLIAARVVTGKIKKAHPDTTSLEVRFCALGNGWGFGDWLDAGYQRFFTQKLNGRVNEIVAFYRAKDPATLPPALKAAHPYLEVFVRPVGLDGIEPKQAVAWGLLSNATTKTSMFDNEEMSQMAKERRVARAAVVGVDMQLPDKKFGAAWYLDVGAHRLTAPAGSPPCPGAGRVVIDPELPWPTADFVPPSGDMDAVLLAVQEQALAQGAGEWLRKSPYEVLLEEHWLKRLHTMG